MKRAFGSVALFLGFSFCWLGPAWAETPPESATLKLNSDMMVLYDGALKDAQSDLLKAHPVILALFTGQGGTMILYRPAIRSGWLSRPSWETPSTSRPTALACCQKELPAPCPGNCAVRDFGGLSFSNWPAS